MRDYDIALEQTYQCFECGTNITAETDFTCPQCGKEHNIEELVEDKIIEYAERSIE